MPMLRYVPRQVRSALEGTFDKPLGAFRPAGLPSVRLREAGQTHRQPAVFRLPTGMPVRAGSGLGPVVAQIVAAQGGASPLYRRPRFGSTGDDTLIGGAGNDRLGSGPPNDPRSPASWSSVQQLLARLREQYSAPPETAAPDVAFVNPEGAPPSAHAGGPFVAMPGVYPPISPPASTARPTTTEAINPAWSLLKAGLGMTAAAGRPGTTGASAIAEGAMLGLSDYETQKKLGRDRQREARLKVREARADERQDERLQLSQARLEIAKKQAAAAGYELLTAEDGTVYRVNARTGQSAPLVDESGKPMIAKAKALTPAQRRDNVKIKSARGRVQAAVKKHIRPGETPRGVLRRLTTEATATGRVNPAYDALLGQDLKIAINRKVGEDPGFDAFFAFLERPHSAPRNERAPAAEPPAEESPSPGLLDRFWSLFEDGSEAQAGTPTTPTFPMPQRKPPVPGEGSPPISPRRTTSTLPVNPRARLSGNRTEAGRLQPLPLTDDGKIDRAQLREGPIYQVPQQDGSTGRYRWNGQNFVRVD